ncbi:hypothetical protein D3C81_1879070 [compost metagenome]
MPKYRITLDPMGAITETDDEYDAARELIAHLMDKYKIPDSDIAGELRYPRREFASLRIDEVLDRVDSE